MNDTYAKALAVAIDLLRQQIANLPMSLAMAAGKSPGQLADEAHARGKSTLDTLGFGRAEGFGGNRIRSGSADLNGGNKFIASLGSLGTQALGKLGSGAGALLGAFGKLLGPLGSLTTFLTASTSGFQIFSQAMQLFAATVAPIIMPVFFLLATGLVALSDVFMKKLMPAMDGLYKVLLQSGIPALEGFIGVVGRAADALKAIADSRVGRALGAGLTEGGTGGKWGAIDRLTGGGSIESDGSTAGTIKRIERAGFDALEAWLPSGGDTIRRGSVSVAKGIFGDYVDPYSGVGTKKVGTEAGSTVNRAAADVVRQMMMSSGSQASVGDIRGSFRQSQMRALSMTPFEQRMLDIAQKQLAALQRGVPLDQKEVDEYNTAGGGRGGG